MLKRPALVALNKLDLVSPAQAARAVRAMRGHTGMEVFAISAHRREGLAPLTAAIAQHLHAIAQACRMSQLIYKREAIAKVRRLVVKIGSAVISDAGGLRADVIEQIALQVDSIVRDGREVVLVTSGAVAAGRARLSLLKRGASIAARQAEAAVGQIELMATYSKHFAAYDRHNRPIG